MSQAKVETNELVKAMRSLSYSDDEIKKALNLESLEGAENNGGNNSNNELKAKVNAKLQKAKEDLEAITSDKENIEKCSSAAASKVSKLEDLKGKLEKGEEVSEEELEKAEESEEVTTAATQKPAKETKEESDEVKELKKSVESLITLQKSSLQQINDLTQQVSSFSDTPQERRSASSVEVLRKGVELGLPIDNANGIKKYHSKLQKSQINAELMGIFETITDPMSKGSIGDQIIAYETSGELSPGLRDLLKGKSIEVIS